MVEVPCENRTCGILAAEPHWGIQFNNVENTRRLVAIVVLLEGVLTGATSVNSKNVLILIGAPAIDVPRCPVD